MEKVVITDLEYQKADTLFEEYSDRIKWIPCPDDEKSVSQAVKQNGARIAVLGITKYKEALYAELSANSGDDPALIVRYGVGYDGVDLEQCKRYNVMLAITPGASSVAVAECAVALMLSLARHVPECDKDMKNGGYQHVTGFELGGKTLGIAGLGKIGKKTAQIGAFGFHMNVICYDILSLEKQASMETITQDAFLQKYGIKEYYNDYQAFAKNVDMLSIHMPSNKETYHYFNKQRIDMLKNGAYIVNTARGAIIDDSALYAALSNGRISAAGLDVFHKEPYEPTEPAFDFRTLPNVVLTPHLGGDTVESNQNIVHLIMENITNYQEQTYDKLHRIV